MLLAEKSTGHVIEVLDIHELFDPLKSTVKGSMHYGQEAQDPEHFPKSELSFPSGEALPQCWTDPDYRRKES
ncbi:MAG: acetyltransferase [Oleiphilaceae bacterium]|nr:acetyltransferase [Oleiphilaceae bacterium]